MAASTITIDTSAFSISTGGDPEFNQALVEATLDSALTGTQNVVASIAPGVAQLATPVVVDTAVGVVVTGVTPHVAAVITMKLYDGPGATNLLDSDTVLCTITPEVKVRGTVDMDQAFKTEYPYGANQEWEASTDNTGTVITRNV